TPLPRLLALSNERTGASGNSAPRTGSVAATGFATRESSGTAGFFAGFGVSSGDGVCAGASAGVVVDAESDAGVTAPSETPLLTGPLGSVVSTGVAPDCGVAGSSV